MYYNIINYTEDIADYVLVYKYKNTILMILNNYYYAFNIINYFFISLLFLFIIINK